MNVRFDPELVSLRSLEQHAKEACGRLAAQYCHRTLVVGGLDCADCAKSIERALRRGTGRPLRRGRLRDRPPLSRVRLRGDAPGRGHKGRPRFGLRGLDRRGIPRSAQDPVPTTVLSGGRPASAPHRAELRIPPRRVGGVARALPPISQPWPLLAAAIVVGGYPVARNAWNTIVRTRNVDMNVLMTVAAVGAAAVGQWVEAALVTFLFGLGTVLQAATLDRTRRAITGLMELAPPRGDPPAGRARGRRPYRRARRRRRDRGAARGACPRRRCRPPGRGRRR